MQTDEPELVFSAKRMMNRVKLEGNGYLLDAKTLAFIQSLDGQPVSANSWNRQVRGEPVLSCQTKAGDFVDVSEKDCIPRR